MENWKKKADELIKKALEAKNKMKDGEASYDGCKEQLGKLMQENNISEYSGEYGSCNFVDFERVGLVKDKVEATVNQVNDGSINKIDMKDITKDIAVHFVSVKGIKGAE